MSASIVTVGPPHPLAEGVRVVCTTRAGGVSRSPWDALNLGEHVGDDPAAVRENRRRLRETLALPAEPRWLSQVHGREVADLDHASDAPIVADAAHARTPGRVAAVLTADCVPIAWADADGAFGVIHAGWRGIAAGVVAAALEAARVHAARVRAWIGPAIGASAYEIDDAVREALRAQVPPDVHVGAFVTTRPGHWHADLAALVAGQLAALGVRDIERSGLCTATDGRFYSHRREGRTGRFATLVWREGAPPRA